MLTKQAFELQDVQSEYDQSPIEDERRLVPLDQTKQTTEFEGEEIQVAGIYDGISLGLAPAVSRGVSGKKTLGNAWQRLQQKRKDEAAKDAARPPGTDASERYQVIPSNDAFDAVDTQTDNLMGRFATKEDADKFLLQEKAKRADRPNLNVAPQPRTKPVDEIPIEEKAITPSLKSEMERNDSYNEWLTLGDEETDILMKTIRDKTEIKGGLIGGVRVEGTQPGMEIKIPDEGNIYSILEANGKIIEKALGKEKLKSISLEQTREMADLIGENPEKLRTRFLSNAFNLENTNPGQLAAQMVAAKDLLLNEIRKLDELTDVARSVDQMTPKAQLDWMQQYEMVANIQRVYRGAKTDLGRALSALRTPARTDQALLARDYSNIIDEAGGTAKIADLIDAYSKEPDIVSRLKQVRQVSKIGRILDGVHEMWVNSMLSGWRTHMKNTVGSTLQITADIGETYTSAAIESPKVLYGGTRHVTFGDAQAKVFGEIMAVKAAVRASGRAFWLREAPLSGGEMTIVSGQNTLRPDAISAENWNVSNTTAGTAINALGNIVTLGRVPMRLLAAGDAVNKTIAYHGKLFEAAHRAGRLEGKKGEALEEFITDFVFEPPDSVAQEALEFAKYVTLQSDMEPGFFKNLQKLSGSRFGRLIIPFYKTPTDSLFYVGERTPFALLMKKRFREPYRQGGAARSMALTKMATGSAFMLTLALLYDDEKFTGGISSDPNIRNIYARQGIRPYHMKIGDYWYNYNLIEPYSTIIGLVSDALEVIAHRDTDDRTATEVWLGVAGVVGYNLQNKTFMAGLNAALEAMGNPSRYGDKMLKNYVRSMYPGSAAIKEFRTWTDELKRLRIDLADIYRENLPGLSKTLQPKLDLWGRQIENSFIRTPYKPNKVDEELARLRLAIQPHPMSLNADIGLLPEEITWFHERAGKGAFKELSALLNPKTEIGRKYAKVQRASKAGNADADRICKEMIRKIVNNYRQIARIELLTDSPFSTELTDLMDRINDEKLAKGMETIQLIKEQQ